MHLRKLSPAEAARLCSCGLWPHEPGHTQCRVWRDKEIARLGARIVALQAQLAQLVSPAAARRGILVLPEPPGWRCAACASDVFARSARDPERCIRCVSRQEVAA